MPMDPLIKALSAARRDIRKIVDLVDDVGDKAQVLDMVQRELDKLRTEIVTGNATRV